MKRITFMILFSTFFFLAGVNILQAQEVVLSDEFDSGDGLWNSGWVDAANATVAFSIDTTGKLSGKNSYKIAITSAQNEMWRIQRLHDLPLVAGYVYTVSFMAVSDSADAGINCLFELVGDPYTKRIDDTASVTNTPQTFSYTMTATENVPTNQVKFMFGGARNSGKTIWFDNVVVTRVPDPNLVTLWGRTSDGYGAAWPILNDSSTAAGNAGIAGSQPMPAGTNGASVQGIFDTLTATMSQAVVIKGQLEYVGGNMGSDYTPLRYALTFQDSVTLQNQYTDTAKWVSPKKHFGYEFTPRSSTGQQPNGGGGVGSVWTINNGNWASTYSNGGKPIGPVVNQAPRNAEITAGTYNFAISVIQVSDTSNEIRWSMVKTDNSYWFAGTVIDTAVSTKFNSLAFWLKDGEATGFNLKGVRAELGSPITIPEAPWEAYYIDQWGLSKEYNTNWPILNDSDYVVGDAAMGGDPAAGWKGLQGGFGQDVSISTTKAVIVKGQIEFVGADADAEYTPIRYALTYQDSNSTLQNALTDSATWSHAGNHFGYGFHPRTGAGTMSNGSGGQGTVWTINNGNWASTYSNNGGPISQAVQAPRNAKIVAGVYNFAISVQSIDDTTNEIRWYMVEKNNKYWFGGTVRDTAVTKKFNSILFGINEVPWTEFKVIGMQVDLGTPITVPEAPWEAYYIDQWGLSGEYNTNWPILNDSDYVVGDAAMGGDPAAGWKGLQGGFGQDVGISTTKAVIVKGQIEFVGADADAEYTPIRYALTYQDSNSTLQNALTDSATWSHAGNHFGYGFHPRTGAGTMSNGSGGQGTVWTINNGNWASTYSNNGKPIAQVVQAPRNAKIVAGVYNFAISVQSIDSVTNEIRWYMVEKNNKYWFGGTVRDTAVTKKFNSILFGINEVPWTEFKVIGMQVDLGTPITVPEAPWEAYYIDQWGFFGGKMGGWTISNTDITGNVTASGSSTNTDWVALLGQFQSFTPTTSRPLKNNR